MDIYMIALRLVHILGGVFWAGSIFMLVGYIQPTAKALGPESGKFMQRLTGGSLPLALIMAPVLNVLAGLLMYWKDSGGLNSAWITSAAGLGFTVGGLLGLAALYIGFFVSRPALLGLAALGKEMQMGGKPPTPEQGQRIGKMQETLTNGTLWTAILLTFTLIAMATARYI